MCRRIICENNFPRIEKRQLSHFDASLFLKILMIMVFLYSLGTFSDFQMHAKNTKLANMQELKQDFVISADIFSLPGTVPFFTLLAAITISSIDGSSVLI